MVKTNYLQETMFLLEEDLESLSQDLSVQGMSLSNLSIGEILKEFATKLQQSIKHLRVQMEKDFKLQPKS